MLKFLSAKHLFLSLFIFIFGFCSTLSLGTPQKDRDPLNIHYQNMQYQNPLGASSVHKKVIFSNWFNTVSTRSVIIKSTNSNEIWNRVRQRLHLHAPASATLYHRHIKEYAKSQSYINELINNASPYL